MRHSWCSYLFLLSIEATIQLCFITTVECVDDHNLNSGSKDLILHPINPEVEDGRWLTLNCTILPHYTGNYTNRDLYFRHGNFNFTNTTLVGSSTALLRLQWTLADDGIGGGHINCALPDRPFVWSAVQHVTVVRRPLQPTVTDCLLLNWKYVNCTWTPSSSQQEDHMHTSSPLIQTLQWKLGDEINDIWQDAVCKGEVIDWCVWNISHIVDQFVASDTCCVQLFARLHLTYLHFERQSAPFCFRPRHVVVIDKPRNVTAINASTHQIFVQWRAPLLVPNHVIDTDFVYAVTVMSQWSDTPVINQSVEKRSLSFSSIPHTSYAITVKVKTLESHIWSMPASHSFTTASAIPKMSPASLPNAFTVSHVGQYIRTVVIYWKTLSKQDFYSQSLSYIVLTRKPPALLWNELSVIKSANTSCTEVNVDTDSDVELTVIARNEVGDTLPDIIIPLPAVQSSGMTATRLFNELVVELTNDSTVIWSWRLKSSEHTGNLTLFWCRSHFVVGRCVGDIHWLDVAASQSEYNVSINADDTSHYHYGAALKADSIHPETGGIEWVTCLYSASGSVEPVQDVQAFVPSYGRPGELLVTWVLPPCDHGYRHGYVKSLVLYYCRYAGTECVDEPSHVSLAGYATAYNLTELEPGEEYGIWMYSWTRASQSRNHSDVVITVTSRSVLTPAAIAGLTVSAVIVLLLSVAFVWMLVKYCRRCRDKLWSPVTITAPPASMQSNNTSLSAPIVEYSRISYMRQGSRLSSSSRDSGQFGIDGGSPLILPESCSESVVQSLVVPDNHTPTTHDMPRPAATTYVNDRVVIIRHPTENNHRRPSSLTTEHGESYPLQPMKTRHPHEAVAGKAASADAADDDEDDTNVTDRLVNHRLNGGYDIAVPRQNTDYIPHEWLKM